MRNQLLNVKKIGHALFAVFVFITQMVSATFAADPIAQNQQTQQPTKPANSQTVSSAAAGMPSGSVYGAAMTSTLQARDVTKPAISTIKGISAGSVIKRNIVVTANVVDAGGVKEVGLYQGGVMVAAGIKSTDPKTPNQYNFQLDTRKITNGSKSLTIKALDTSGNSSVSPAIWVTVNNDYVKPAIGYAYPADGEKISGIAKLRVAATDNIGVSKVEWYVNGNLIGSSVSGSSGAYIFDWDSKSAPNGLAAFTVKVYDADGNYSVRDGKVTIENIPPDFKAPLVYGVNLQNETKVSGEVTITANVSDEAGGSGLKSVALYNGITKIADGVLVAGLFPPKYEFKFNSKIFSNGPLNLAIHARDNSLQATNGNLTTAPISLIVDNDLTKPVIKSVIPAAGSNVNGVVRISVNATDNVGVSKIELWRGTEKISVDPASSNAFIWDTASLAPGLQSFVAKVYDAAGNVQTQDFNLNIYREPRDTKPPFVRSLTVNGTVLATEDVVTAQNILVSGTQVNMRLDAVDNDLGLGRVELWAGDRLVETVTALSLNLWLDPATQKAINFTWDSTKTPNGSQSITFRIYDKASNLRTLAVNLQVNNVPGVSVSRPQNGAYVAGKNVAIEALVTDSPAAIINRVELWRGTALISTINSSGGPFIFSWDSTTVPNGGQDFTLKAIDAKGNSQTAALRLNVNNDLAAPMVSVSVNKTGYIKDDVTISVSASDNSGSVARVSILRAGQEIAFKVEGPFDFILDSKTLPNGKQDLEIRVVDAAGNTTVKSMSLDIDNAKPTLTLTSPAVSSGASVAGVINFAATASDNLGVAKTELILAGQTIASVNASSLSHAWDSRLVTDGVKNFIIRVTDLAGNISEQALGLTVSNINSVKPVFTAYRNITERSGMIPFLVQATDNTAVTRIEMWVDGKLIKSVNGGTFDYTFDSKMMVANGLHELTFKAYDAKNNVEILTPAPLWIYNDTQKPSVPSIENPPAGSTVSGLVNLALGVNDDLGVVKAELLYDGKVVASAASSIPVKADYFYLPWDTTKMPAFSTGHMAFTVKVYDAAGNFQVSQVSYKVEYDAKPVINSIAIDRNPTVMSNGTVVDFLDGVVPVLVNAADDKGIAKIELLDGNQIVAVSNNPVWAGGYTVSWDTKLVPDGNRSFTVRVYDVSGNVSTQDINFKVYNAINFDFVRMPSALGVSVANQTGLKVSKVEVTVGTAGTQIGNLGVGVNIDAVGNLMKGIYTLADTDQILRRPLRANETGSLNVKIFDEKNGSTAPSLTVSVAANPPTGSVAGGIVSGNFGFLSVAPANVGITKIEVFEGGKFIEGQTSTEYYYPAANGAIVRRQTPPIGANWPLGIDTRMYPNGLREFTVNVYDANGSMRAVKYKLNIQN